MPKVSKRGARARATAHPYKPAGASADPFEKAAAHAYENLTRKQQRQLTKESEQREPDEMDEELPQTEKARDVKLNAQRQLKKEIGTLKKQRQRHSKKTYLGRQQRKKLKVQIRQLQEELRKLTRSTPGATASSDSSDDEGMED